MGAAYYNELEPFAAQWLRNLIDAGYLPNGVVDERSIADVDAADLDGFTECHFFAGIGVWPLVLKRAAFPDDRVVWTGSCPCQPFSSAGKGAGIDDDRHLWPVWARLIRERRPDLVLGEQVSSPGGRSWWDLVASDLEGMGYAAGALDTCAAGVGAPHIRQRLYWMAHADGERCEGQRLLHKERPGLPEASGGSSAVVMADSASERPSQRDGSEGPQGWAKQPQRHSGNGVVADTVRKGRQGMQQGGLRRPKQAGRQESPCGGGWGDVEWVACLDERARPIEPGTFPLADGPATRVGRLRAYGNALCAPQAQAFVEAVLEVMP